VGPYYVAVGGLLASFACSCALEIAAAVVGLRGAMFETKRRAALPRLIYAITSCVTAQIAFNCYATFLLVQRPPRCTGEWSLCECSLNNVTYLLLLLQARAGIFGTPLKC
jgi:hypothetical protein